MPKISQYSLYFPNPVRLEESPENLLSLVLVFCGEHVFQIVFQVVLRELCHIAIFLKVKILTSHYHEIKASVLEGKKEGNHKCMVPSPCWLVSV